MERYKNACIAIIKQLNQYAGQDSEALYEANLKAIGYAQLQTTLESALREQNNAQQNESLKKQRITERPPDKPRMSDGDFDWLAELCRNAVWKNGKTRTETWNYVQAAQSHITESDFARCWTWAVERQHTTIKGNKSRMKHQRNLDIIAAYQTGEHTLAEVAKMFEVSLGTVKRVIYKK